MAGKSEKKLNEQASLSAALLSTLDEAVFFAKLGNAVKEVFPSDIVQISLAKSDGSFRMVFDDYLLAKPVRTEKGMAAYVKNMKKPYFSNNVARDPILSGFQYAKEIVGELAVPLLVDGAVLGVVTLLSPISKRTYSETDIAQLLDFLNDLSNSLKNMGMYLMAKELNEELLKKIEDKEQGALRNNREEIKLIGTSPIFTSLLERAKKIAHSDINVIISGGAGVGKKALALLIHQESARSAFALEILNCEGLDESILERKIFGVARNAFIGQLEDEQGLLEKTHKGTLVLDKVETLSLGLQAKLGRFIATKEFMRCGDSHPTRSDVRVVMIATPELDNRVVDGSFREELLHHLGAVRLEMPALRERNQDIRLLAEHFLNSGVETSQMKTLTEVAVETLQQAAWAGNIRELKTVMENTRVTTPGMFIERVELLSNSVLVEAVSEEVEEEIEEEAFDVMTLEELEKRHICRALEFTSGNKTKTAKILGITVKTLYNKLHSYNMI